MLYVVCVIRGVVCNTRVNHFVLVASGCNGCTLQLYANEKNIFVGIFNNMLFIYIAFGEIVAQMAISTWGGAVFRVTGGLTATQWLVCWAFALGHVPWHFIIVNAVPLSMFECLVDNNKGNKGTSDADIEAQDTLPSVRLSKSESV
eukprot:COSAG06_NODE_479_length_15167_cov_45.027940_3_plen_146_part_00